MSEQAQEKLFKFLQQSDVRAGLRNDKIVLGGNVNGLTDNVKAYLKENFSLLCDSARNIQKQYDYGWTQYLSDVVNLTDVTQSGSLNKKLQLSSTTASNQQSISASINTRRALSEIENVLRAAWAIVLHRYTSNAQISFITAEPVPTHDHSSQSVLNPIIDCFDISAESNFQHLQERAARNRFNAQGKGFPSQKLLEKTILLNSANPSLLVIDNIDAFEQLSVFFDETAQHFVYAINIEKKSEAISLNLRFDPTRATPDAAQRILSYYVSIISVFLNENYIDSLISQHDFLSESDKQLLLQNWGGANIHLPEGLCVVHLFEQQVSKTPDAICLEEGINRLTYAEVNCRINKFLESMLQLGVQVGQPIGVHMSKSVDLVVACLAIMKAGCAYLPLDKSVPRERIQNICQNAQIKFVLVDTWEGRDLFQSLELSNSLQVLSATELGEVVNNNLRKKLPIMCEHEHVAYIIYTSGSTGAPKGVAVSHKALASFLLHCKKTYRAEDLLSVLFSTRICFDLSIFELFAAFLFGGKLVIVEDILELVDKKEQFDVSFVGSVPSVMAQLLDIGDLPPSVCTLNLGGEPLRRSLVERVFNQSFVSRLHNVYGPTESTVFSTTSLLLGPTDSEPVIGKPVANTQALILDPYGNLAPVGVVGELYLAGLNTANGYVNAEQLTAEKFKKDSKYFDNKTMYCTGDFVRWNDTGELEFIGRKDQQIKLRGFRIEIDEIEVVLNAVPGVLDGAVILYKDEIKGDFLAAYVTVDKFDGSDVITVNAILDSLRVKLPDYMVPKHCIVLDRMPNTASGKIDRKNLAARNISDIISGFRISPVTELQKNICKAFENTLGIKDIGIESDFFALGGHSLLIGKLVRKIFSYTKINIPLRGIFDNSRVDQLEIYLQKIATAQACDDIKSSINELSTEIINDAEASFSQQAYWYKNQLRGATAEYNLAYAFKISGELNESALIGAYDSLIRKHSALRTFLYEASGVIRQGVREYYDLPYIKIDMLSSDTLETTRIAARQFIESSANQPFDLNKDCPTRLVLVNIADKEQFLLLVVHHSAADGVAVKNILQDLEHYYRQGVGLAIQKNQSQICQFINYSVWQRKWIDSPEGIKSINYWQNKLQDVPILHCLPTDFLRPAKQNHSGLIWRTQIPADLTLQLKSLLSTYGASLFMGMQSAFAWLLARSAGQDDIIMGTPSAGRDAEVLETAVGNFMNTVILRNRIPRECCFSELLNQTKSMVLSSFDHQPVPIELLNARLSRIRDDSFNSLYQIWFVMQNQEHEILSFADLAIEGLVQDYTQKKYVHFDLSLSVSEVNGNLELYWGYKDSLFKESTIVYLSDCYKKILEYVVKNPEEKIPESIIAFNSVANSSLANGIRVNLNQINEYLLQEFDWQTTHFEGMSVCILNEQLCVSLINPGNDSETLLQKLCHKINTTFPDYLQDIYLLSSSEEIPMIDICNIIRDSGCLDWQTIKQSKRLSGLWHVHPKDIALYVSAILLFVGRSCFSKFEITSDELNKIYVCESKTGVIKTSFVKRKIELDENESLMALNNMISNFIGLKAPSKIYIKNDNDSVIGFTISDSSIEIFIVGDELSTISNMEFKSEITELVYLIENTAYIKIKDVAKYTKQNSDILVSELKSRFG
ncbi:MAG: amino acid adenylation domain-containing protein [Pseudomonadota bacterium]